MALLNEDTDIIYKSLFLDRAIPHHISVLVSGAERIGTSWCALNLAYALNAAQKKVLLVDVVGHS